MAEFTKAHNILTPDEIMKIFDINKKRAKKLIREVNQKCHDRGYVTVKNRVLRKHLERFLG